MLSAVSAILIKLLPYIVSLIVGVVGWALKKLWAKWLAKISNERIASALDALGSKAGTVVEALEQTLRPQLAKATSDGKLTADEAKAMAKAALDRLLSVGAPEIRTLEDEGMDKQAVQSLASSMLEQAVYRLPPPPKPAVMDYQAKIEALKPVTYGGN
jgi:hypothetical protein